MPDPLMTLSIRQPWAWLICNRGKNVENRSWMTDYRGPLLIHAGLALDHFACDILRAKGHVIPYELKAGGIVGHVRLMGCVGPAISCNSMWAEEGQCHWLLEDRAPIEFIPCKGRLGLFDLWKHAPEAAARFVELQKKAMVSV
jgi:hypothetical protein